MADRERLLRLTPPPGDVRPYPRWAEVEDRLGHALPADYKWLVDTYGQGSFDDFLYVHLPETPHERLRLESRNDGNEVQLTSLKATRTSMPYAVDELFLVAGTDTMDLVHWLCRPLEDPDKWTIAVLEGGGVTWSEFPGGIVDWLGATFDGSFRTPFMPEDFPSDELGFQALR